MKLSIYNRPVHKFSTERPYFDKWCFNILVMVFKLTSEKSEWTIYSILFMHLL